MRKRGISVDQAKKIRAANGIKDTNLQIARVSRGMSQRDLADASGVTLRAIQQYEQGNRPIEGAKLETLCRLCVALDCKIADILDSRRLVRLHEKVK